MQKQDILSILITFVVGFFAGGYLYLTQFAVVFNPDTVTTEAALSEFAVIGEEYGGCGEQCPSFQVLEDGSYRYKYVPAGLTESIIKSGTLPLTLRRELVLGLTTAKLVAQSQVVDTISCKSEANGIDRRYRVTLAGDDYVLNSCGTLVDEQSNTWQGLAKLWSYFETIE
jgi:hypothetical protein